MKKCDILLIFALNLDCGHLLEPPPQGDGSNVFPRIMFRAKIRKISHRFMKVIIFTAVKNRSILHRACYRYGNESVGTDLKLHHSSTNHSSDPLHQDKRITLKNNKTLEFKTSYCLKPTCSTPGVTFQDV